MFYPRSLFRHSPGLLLLIAACGGQTMDPGPSSSEAQDAIEAAGVGADEFTSQAGTSQKESGSGPAGAESGSDPAGAESGKPAASAGSAQWVSEVGGGIGQGGAETATIAGAGETGQPGTGGASGAAGAPIAPVFMACDAAAECRGGDRRLSGPEECPDGVACYSSTVCSDTVWCAPQQLASCNAVPTCRVGDVQSTEPCLESDGCYVVELCDATVTCRPGEPEVLVDAGAGEDQCDPDSEADRRYVATSVDDCAVVRFACEEDEDGFFNACGCGCQRTAPP